MINAIMAIVLIDFVLTLLLINFTMNNKII